MTRDMRREAKVAEGEEVTEVAERKEETQVLIKAEGTDETQKEPSKAEIL